MLVGNSNSPAELSRTVTRAVMVTKYPELPRIIDSPIHQITGLAVDEPRIPLAAKVNILAMRILQPQKFSYPYAASNDALTGWASRYPKKDIVTADNAWCYLQEINKIRLGWHDAGTYDKNIQEWPKCGGANGSLRFEIELKHNANAGLSNALKLLQPVKDKNPNITYADLFQLASATAIEVAGGPDIPMKYGRVDASGPEDCPPEGKLPGTQPSKF
eukprot:Gb_14036 [translate_table: standard]